MRSKRDRGFTLLEVLVTMAILTSAIVFIFRSFAAALGGVQLSQNLGQACYLVEAKIWEARQEKTPSPSRRGSEGIFNWSLADSPTGNSNLTETVLEISWRQNLREKPYNATFYSYYLNE